MDTAKKLAAFRRYYAQLRAASVTSTKLKLVVIGWGEHGKSSLVLRLKELESPGAAPSPLPTRSDRTIGIEMTILQDTFVVHDFGTLYNSTAPARSHPLKCRTKTLSCPDTLAPLRRPARVLPLAQVVLNAGRALRSRDRPRRRLEPDGA